MPNTYLPQTDSGLNDWSANFVSQLAATTDPTTIGLTAADVSDYAQTQNTYSTAYTAAIDPATRGSATVLAKNLAKETLVSESRRLAMIITNHPGVTDQQRHDFGLTVRDTERTPVPVPDTSPMIDVVSVEGQRINLRLHNDESTSRAKPTGVKGATLFTYVGDTTPAEISDWKFEGNVTRTIVTLEMAATTAPGSKVWITAFWFNTKGQSGPATSPVSTYLGGGLSQAA